MSKKSENNISCIYVYMDRCGPCAQTTPIIDTMISCGIPVVKMLHTEAPQPLKRFGTPSIAFYDNEKGEIIGDVLSTTHIQGFKAMQSLGYDVPDFPDYLIAQIKKHKITNNG